MSEIVMAQKNPISLKIYEVICSGGMYYYILSVTYEREPWAIEMCDLFWVEGWRGHKIWMKAN